jgi:hypothetical protein
MAQTHSFPSPPRHPAWDITFSRLAQAIRPKIGACAGDLAQRFQAMDLGVDMRARQTPRGLSTFVSLVGPQGLICIVDLTLVDGMALGQGPVSALDIRLLDARGEVVASGLARDVEGLQDLRMKPASAADSLSPECLAQAATAAYVATLARFDLPSAR